MELEAINSSSQLNHMVLPGRMEATTTAYPAFLECFREVYYRFVKEKTAIGFSDLIDAKISQMSDMSCTSASASRKKEIDERMLLVRCSTCRISSKLNVLNPTELLGRPLRQIFKCLATMPIDLECYICHAMAGIMWPKVYGFRQKVPARGLCLWCEHKSPRKMSVKEGDNMNLVSYESANGFSRRTNLNKDSTLLNGLNEAMVGNQPC
ncbi:Uncharacterized protein Rs2_19887 [Raphanus sativus]|nr:Uncharacterized protein Rs2_19887 [Raphanus sativus]